MATNIARQGMELTREPCYLDKQEKAKPPDERKRHRRQPVSLGQSPLPNQWESGESAQLWRPAAAVCIYLHSQPMAKSNGFRGSQQIIIQQQYFAPFIIRKWNANSVKVHDVLLSSAIGALIVEIRSVKEKSITDNKAGTQGVLCLMLTHDYSRMIQYVRIQQI